MIKVISETKKPIKLWLPNLEAEAEQQVRNLSTLPFIFNHVAVMPDAHAGRGSTVGTVIATKGAIIPAAVGVDIGCGMCALKLPFKVDLLGGDESLKKLRHSIERSVPVGFNKNHTVSLELIEVFTSLGSNTLQSGTDAVPNRILTNALHQLGSLGGGNHFIEVCKDQNDDCWIMLHSGSRNIGKHLAEVHIDKAKGLMKEYFISLPDPDLAYLAQNTTEFKSYLQDLMWAQNFAMANRNEMMNRVLREVLYHVGQLDQYNQILGDSFRVNCHHNYTSIEHHFGSNVYITRKGAVSAREGEWGIIPGSMGTKSYIVQGLGNPESFTSCSHGAGRKMSRTKARNTFTKEDLAIQTAGVECRKDTEVIDEIPGAYKDISEVMDNQADLVKPVFELKQLLCVKG